MNKKSGVRKGGQWIKTSGFGHRFFVYYIGLQQICHEPGIDFLILFLPVCDDGFGFGFAWNRERQVDQRKFVFQNLASDSEFPGCVSVIIGLYSNLIFEIIFFLA